jgi:vacuolar-type H+-ATPase subunit H
VREEEMKRREEERRDEKKRRIEEERTEVTERGERERERFKGEIMHLSSFQFSLLK